MDPTSGSRLGHCRCGAPARYTCPLCAAKTCSVACAKAHKLNTPCTGIAKKVHEKGLKANEWNWGNLMRDQSYLSGLGRVVDGAGRALVGGGLIPSANSTLSASGATDFSSGSAAAVGRLDELSEKESRIRREAGKSEGVRLVILPKGMTRRGKNATKWDQTCGLLEQICRWLTRSQRQVLGLDHRVHRPLDYSWENDIAHDRPSTLLDENIGHPLACHRDSRQEGQGQAATCGCGRRRDCPGRRAAVARAGMARLSRAGRTQLASLLRTSPRRGHTPPDSFTTVGRGRLHLTTCPSAAFAQSTFEAVLCSRPDGDAAGDAGSSDAAGVPLVCAAPS